LLSEIKQISIVYPHYLVSIVAYLHQLAIYY
jgi:hypothetical protein